MTNKFDHDVAGDAAKSDANSVKPVDFSKTLESRREERMRRRDGKKLDATESTLDPLDASVTSDAKRPMRPRVVQAAKPVDDGIETKKRQRTAMSTMRQSMTAITFFIMVLLPTLGTVYYYYMVASPQYRVETQFSVRGSNGSINATLGLGGMFGNSVQSSDSYIVSSYIESVQLIRDLRTKDGIDLRTFFSRPGIDMMYKIDPNMPVEEFVDYWRSVTDISFNSTTGNVTFYLYAFSPQDAKVVADAVLKASENLVNTLSESSRVQLTDVANKMVERSEQRLKKVRLDIQALRNTEGALDPSQIVNVQNNITSNIENQLSNLKTRLAAVTQAASSDTPSAKVIKRQIGALEQQLADHKARLAPSDGKTVDASGKLKPENESNLSDVVSKFEELNVELGFATQAYTSSLAALESALLEAQKQERYFATFVDPDVPEVSLFPHRLMDSIVAFLIFLAVWLVCQFLYRSVRDHAI